MDIDDRHDRAGPAIWRNKTGGTITTNVIIGAIQVSRSAIPPQPERSERP